MENHDLILGQNQDLSLGQSNGFDLGHTTDNNHGVQSFSLAQNYDNNNQNGCEFDLGQNQNPEHEHGGSVDDAHLQMVIAAQHYDLGLGDDHELIGYEQVEQNLELAIVDQNQEMDFEANSEDMMIHEQQHLLLNAPVLQSRELVPNPNYELTVGQEFEDVKSCRRALRDAAIALHYEIQTVKSDKSRFTAKCASEGCPWRVHAAKLPGVPTFTIRTINQEHTCGGITHLGHQQASVQWVAKSVEQRLRENPHYKPKEILEDIHKAHGITLSYKQAWRGKERVMAAVRGSFEEEYRLLPQYCDQIKQTNPGSIASVYGNPQDSCFRRLFVSFQASIFGFVNACRPLLGLDRTQLKNKYLGTLLFASGFDGDGALFPLAYGVVDEESDDNWMWFLSELHNLLEVNSEYMPRLTILSNRQKSVVDAVEAYFPTAFHGFCMRHLSDCFQKEFNNTMLVNLLWEAAWALTPVEHEGKILEIAEISLEAATWIRRISPKFWATAYFEGSRFGHLTANIVESLHSWISEASGLPIIQMMECIRRQLMTWFNERRETSTQWTTILVPSVERRVSEALERAHSYQVLRANESEFEVISHEGTNMVDIYQRGCSCKGWQLYGIPCAHAVAVLVSCRQNVRRFTESCFTAASYQKTYSQTLHPVPDKALWKESSDDAANPAAEVLLIKPPKSLTPPGRPRKKRVRAEDRGSVKRVVHCSRCNQTGHFRTTCAAPI